MQISVRIVKIVDPGGTLKTWGTGSWDGTCLDVRGEREWGTNLPPIQFFA